MCTHSKKNIDSFTVKHVQEESVSWSTLYQILRRKEDEISAYIQNWSGRPAKILLAIKQLVGLFNNKWWNALILLLIGQKFLLEKENKYFKTNLYSKGQNSLVMQTTLSKIGSYFTLTAKSTETIISARATLNYHQMK